MRKEITGWDAKLEKKIFEKIKDWKSGQKGINKDDFLGFLNIV